MTLRNTKIVVGAGAAAFGGSTKIGEGAMVGDSIETIAANGSRVIKPAPTPPIDEHTYYVPTGGADSTSTTDHGAGSILLGDGRIHTHTVRTRIYGSDYTPHPAPKRAATSSTASVMGSLPGLDAFIANALANGRVRQGAGSAVGAGSSVKIEAGATVVSSYTGDLSSARHVMGPASSSNGGNVVVKAGRTIHEEVHDAPPSGKHVGLGAADGNVSVTVDRDLERVTRYGRR